MAVLTGQHVGEPMAIVLDDEVYSAPRLNSTISDSGVITGQFGEEDISYLIRVLTAGSLEAKVSSDPISINVLGPSIGADNLEKGLEATIISVGITCVVMLLYYFMAGLVAVAVPVQDRSGRMRAAIAVHGPTARMSLDDALARLPALKAAARRMGKLL